MQYFIDGIEVDEKNFKDTLFGLSIFEQDKNDLTLSFLRAFIAITLPKVQTDSIDQMVREYVFEVAFAGTNAKIVNGVLFEVKRKEEEMEEENVE